MRLESEHNAGLLYGYARESDQTYTACLASKISFEFAKDNPRIQVADLLAREAMKALDNFVGPVKRPIRKSWKALADTNRFDVAAFSTEWFSSMKQQYAEVQKIVGFNQNDYVQWLKDRNRQDSISNKFHFITWIARRDKEARQMSTWYKVTLPSEECGLDGLMNKLQEAFTAIFIAKSAHRHDVALFTDHDDNFENHFFYFSPGAGGMMPHLIEIFKGVPCEQPVLHDKMILLVGHAGAREALLRSAGKS